MSIVRVAGSAVVFALLMAAFAAAPYTARCEGPRVAVFPIKNNGQAQYTGLSSGLAAMLTTNLNKSDKLEVVEPQAVLGRLARVRLTGGAPGLEDTLRASRELDADYAVTGSFLMFGGKFRVDIRVYDVGSGTLSFADKAHDKEDAFFDKVDEISDRIILSLAGSLPRPKVSLSVESVPPGAGITLDGEDAGETPRVIEGVEPGEHRVDLDLYGYKPYSETVTVKEGEPAEVMAELVPMNGGIRVWWLEAPSSDVQIGPEVIRASHFVYDQFTPQRKYCRNLPAGEYRVTVRMPYKDETSWETARIWKTYSEEVEIRPGEVTDVYIYNRLFSPSLDISACAACADYWDFDTDLVWYETVN